MKKNHRLGFTLIEVLVALALAGVITALSILLLHTTRQVTLELQEPVTTSMDALRSQLQTDLDHFLPTTEVEEEPPLKFSQTEGLQLISLRPDDQGIPHAYLIRYTLEDRDLQRIATGGIPMNASTTVVLRSVRSFLPRGFLDGEALSTWPIEKSSGQPQRIEVDLHTLEPNQRTILSLDLPASFRVDQSVPD